MADTDLAAQFMEAVVKRDAEFRAKFDAAIARAITEMANNALPRLARRQMSKRAFRRWRARYWRPLKPR